MSKGTYVNSVEIETILTTEWQASSEGMWADTGYPAECQETKALQKLHFISDYVYYRLKRSECCKILICLRIRLYIWSSVWCRFGRISGNCRISRGRTSVNLLSGANLVVRTTEEEIFQISVSLNVLLNVYISIFIKNANL